MLNRPNPLTREVLDARREVGAVLHAQRDAVPASPFDWSAFDAGQVAGERGAAVRESNAGQDMSKRFKAARAKAFTSCFIQ